MGGGWWRLAIAATIFSTLASPAAGAVRAFAVSSLVTVRPGSAVAGSDVARLEAARGEWESFQIVVRATDARAEIALAATSLTGPGGARLPAPAIAREALLDLATPSSIEGAAGRWPDPLVPAIDSFVGERRRAFPFPVEPGGEVTAWLDLFVPRGAAPGRYRGEVTISDGGRVAARIGVELLVHRFALPASSSLPVAFGFSSDTAGRGHFGRAPTDEEALALTRRYALSALRHRISLIGGTMDPPAFTVGPRGAVTIDPRRYDEEVGPFLDGTADPGGPADGARWSATDLRVPARLEGAIREAYVRALVAHLRARGWLDRVFDYTWDEPPDAVLPAVRARAETLHRAAPTVPRLVTRALNPALLGSVDIWCPTVNLLDDKPGNSNVPPRAAYDERLRRGERLWWYQACMSHGCDIVGGDYFTGWPSLAVDAPAVAHRVLEWLTYRYRVGGELYYNTVEAWRKAAPWSDILRHGGNGDGTLYYPGRPSEIGGRTDIPIESIRLARVRDGLEDYEYLVLLERERGRAVAERFATRIAARTFHWDHDPAHLLAARAEIARLLDER